MFLVQKHSFTEANGPKTKGSPKNSKMKISAVIITKNEERNIERCLQSLIDVVDEIVVIDSCSTDKTAEICQSFGVKFVARPFAGYAATKNYGNNLAEHPWVFAIDADEALSPKLQQSIIELKKKPFEDVIYLVKTKTNYCGKKWINHCGWYPEIRKRFFQKEKTFWEGDIHERLNSGGTKTKLIDADLLHYSYDSISDHLNRINLYTNIIAEKSNKKAPLYKVVFSPMVNFIKIYFIKQGFRDGYYGLIVSVMSAYYTFLKYAKIRERNQI